MKVYGLICMLALLLFSCQESEEEKLTRLFQEWEGKEIVFPEDCTFSSLSKSECESPTLDAPFKVVCYMDSLGCMSCKLKIPEWKQFIHEVDSMSDGKVSFFFYYHPKEKFRGELEVILKEWDFCYPVCIDKEDIFKTINLLPADESFHVFILDGQNRVKAIGNPIQNPFIKELYLKILSGEGWEEDRKELTEVFVNENLLELGNLDLGKKVSRKIVISNLGKVPLDISDIITSCSCVSAKSSTMEIMPGEKGDITIGFTPDESGTIIRDVYVFCNTKETPVTIQIKGNVK